MKKMFITIALLCITAIGALACYHSVGWFRGDLLGYMQENFQPDGETIISGEYLETGEDEQGGYVLYQVTTESGNVHYIRVNVVFHRYLTKVGADYKIRGMEEVSNFSAE